MEIYKRKTGSGHPDGQFVPMDKTESMLHLHTSMIQMITEGNSLHDILKALTIKLEKHFNRKTYCSLLLTVEGNRLSVEHAPNLPSEYLQAIHLIKAGPDVGSCGAAIHRKKTVIVSDIEHDPLWKNFRSDALRFGLKACWSTPILIDGLVVGVFGVYHSEVCTPAAHEIVMLETCARLAGLAIERDQRIKLEQQLQESEQRFKSLFDYHPHSVCILSLEGIMLGFNRAPEPIYGYSNEELFGKSFFSLIASEEREKVIHYFDQAKKGIVQHYECTYMNKNGNHHAVSFTNLPIVVNGEVVGVYGISHDITREKQIEQDLEESRHRYQSLFYNNPDVVYSLDVNGFLMNTNLSASKTLGYAPEEIKGNHWEKFVEKQFIDEVTYFFEKALEGIPQTFETILIHKNGRRIFFQVTNMPIIVNNQIVGVHGMAKDITDRKQSQQELLHLKQQMELVLDSVGDGIYVMDEKLKIKLVNSAGAKLLGYEPQELIKKMPKDTFKQTIALEHCPPYQTLQDGKTRQVTDEYFFKKDGTSFPVEYVVSPIRENKKISGVVVAFKDVSDKKMAEDYLLKSAKLEMAGQLAAGVAHEIRNPLTSIRGFIQLLEETAVNQPEYFSIIRQEFERIEGIIGEFLALAKPQAVNFQENDVGLILEQTIHLMSAQAIMQGIEFVSAMEPGLPLVPCDKHQLKQVFINIIKNALEATSTKGQLLITCKKTDAHIHITFKDQGAGIPKERIKHLFEPFYSTKEKGTGLGLMISYKIIEEHKGVMRVESEEGKGTAVHIILPL